MQTKVRSRGPLIPFLLAGAFSVMPFNGFGQSTYNWDSGTSASWATPGNWSPSGIPGAGDTLGTPLQSGGLNMDDDRDIAAIDFAFTSSGLNISPGSTGPITRTLNVGSITKSGAPNLTLGSGQGGASGRFLNLNAGSITGNGGFIDFLDATNINVSGLVKLNAGTLRILSTSATRNFNGGVHFAGGGFDINRTGLALTTRVAFISGTSGSIQGSTNALAVTSTLEINGATGSSSFSGVIQNGGANRITALAKTGGSTQILAGSSNNYSGGTSISGGTLLVTNASGSGTGTGPVSVLGGGGFGGSGDGVVAGVVTSSAGSFLIPGGDGTTGNLRLGNTVDISGLVGGLPGGLLFDLGAAGDRVTLTVGTLEIGAGLLGFEDFNFSTFAGFGEGTYTLFETSGAISGGLSSNLTGILGGMSGTISLADANSDIILTVAAVPECSPAMLLALGAAILAFRARCRGDFRKV